MLHHPPNSNHSRFLAGVVLVSVLLGVCAPPLSAESATLRAGGIYAVITDNEAWQEHVARYNGLAFLSRGEGYENIFHVNYGGFNLENIFDREREDARDVPQPQHMNFEPRNIPMKLRRLSADTVELFQVAGPQWGIENRARFRVREPYYLDIDFQCTPRQSHAHKDFLGLFWANYVNAPTDGAIYFLGRAKPEAKMEWIRFITPGHAEQSTVLPEGSTIKTDFAPGYGKWLWSRFSENVFSYPFLYGIVKGQLFLLMFDRMPNLRLAHSPSGGGGTPAWDFQFIIPDYQVGKRYGFRARIAIKEFSGRDHVIREYERWSKQKVQLPGSR